MADLLYAFVNPDGSQMDLAMRLSPEFDLKSELSSGRANVLAKTDCLPLRDSRTTKNTSPPYNYFQNQYVGNYKNWVFAQPVKDWCLVAFTAAYDNVESLMEMGLLAPSGDLFPQTWGAVYQRFFL